MRISARFRRKLSLNSIHRFLYIAHSSQGQIDKPKLNIRKTRINKTKGIIDKRTKKKKEK